MIRRWEENLIGWKDHMMTLYLLLMKEGVLCGKINLISSHPKRVSWSACEIFSWPSYMHWLLGNYNTSFLFHLNNTFYQPFLCDLFFCNRKIYLQSKTWERYSSEFFIGRRNYENSLLKSVKLVVVLLKTSL